MSYDVLAGLDDHNEKNLALLPSKEPKKLNWQDELDLYIQIQSSAYISNDHALSLFDYVDPNVSLASYIEKWASCLDHKLEQQSKQCEFQVNPLHIKAYARVGLIGNPSDGFFGKKNIKNC